MGDVGGQYVPRGAAKAGAGVEGVSTGDLLERLSLALWDLREELASAEREAARMTALHASGEVAAELLVFAGALERQNERLRDHLAALWADYASLRTAA